MKRDSLAPYIWMLLGCVCFTAMYAFVHELRDECDWAVIAIFRTALAFLFALALAIAWRAQLVFLRPRALWIRSIAGSISLLCSFFAMTRNVPVSNVLAINNMFPIWVALLAWPALGMKPSFSVFASVLTGVAGVFLIRTPELESGAPWFDLQQDETLSAVFALMASFATAVAMLGLNRLSWIDTRAVVAHFSGVSFIFCVGALMFSDRLGSFAPLAKPLVVLMLLGVGVSATAGQICLTKAFTIGVPAKVAVVALSQIVMTLLLDVALFGETFSALNLAGIALVIAPTAWIIIRQRLRARPVEETTVSPQPWTANEDAGDST